MFQQRFDYLKLPNHISESIQLQETDIKIGQGQSAMRKIFKQQNYDQYELQQISLLTQELQARDKYDPEVYSDDILLRYLYGNKFDIQHTADQLIRTQQILFQNGFLSLDKDIEQVYQKGAIYIEGRTKNHQPCIVVSTKQIEDLNVFERAACLLSVIVEDYMFVPGKIESIILVIQTKDQSAFKMQMERIFQIIQTVQTCFPNSCDSIYILNASLSVNLLWSQIEEMISPVTLNKIKFLKDKERAILSNNFNLEQLEQSLGGEKIIQSYWPPDPNDYLYDPPQQKFGQQQFPTQNSQQQIFEPYKSQQQISQTLNNNQNNQIKPQPTQNDKYYNEEPILFEQNQQSQVINYEQPLNSQIILQSSSPNNQQSYIPNQIVSQPQSKFVQPPNIQSSQQLQQSNQPPIQQDNSEKKRKCICVKCSRDIDEVKSMPKQPKVNQLPPPPATKPNISNIQPQQQQQLLQVPQSSNAKLDDSYVPYERKYDSFVDDSAIYLPKKPIEQNNKEIPPQQSFNEIQMNSPQLKDSQQNNDSISQKPTKPTFSNPYFNGDSLGGSQQMQQQQPQMQTSKSEAIQANMDETIIDTQSDYKPKYPIINRPYEPIQSYKPYQSTSNFQQYNPSNLYQQSYIPSQQQSLQQIYIADTNQGVQQQPVQVQDFEINKQYLDTNTIYTNPYNVNNSLYNGNTNTSQYVPQLSNDPKKKYDFSQWDKYNDNTDPFQNTSSLQHNTPYYSDYKPLYEATDYKPGEFRPSTYNFTPYDYKTGDQQFYEPRLVGTNQSISNQQLYQQKPGQQACIIF